MGATEKKQDSAITTVGDIASSRKCLLFYPEQFTKIILKTMQNTRIGCAGVVDADGNLVGMLTEREILRRIFALVADSTINHANIGKHIDDMIVHDVMIPTPKVLDADTDIEQALETMTELGFRFMPVVNSHNRRKPIGLVDEREVAIHVKNRLDRIKCEAADKEQLLYGLLREPYGVGVCCQTKSN